MNRNERLEQVEQGWHREAEAVLSGLKEWRLQHPRATLLEIEAALDERLDGLRARLLEGLALASRATELSELAAEEWPRCRQCGGPLQRRGRRERTVVTQGDRSLRLHRDYAACPRCGGGLFPPG